jgi:hypothetical protein
MEPAMIGVDNDSGAQSHDRQCLSRGRLIQRSGGRDGAR